MCPSADIRSTWPSIMHMHKYKIGTDENINAVLTIIKMSINQLETTVMMETTVSTTVGKDHYQVETAVSIVTSVRMEMSKQMVKSSELHF